MLCFSYLVLDFREFCDTYRTLFFPTKKASKVLEAFCVVFMEL